MKCHCGGNSEVLERRGQRRRRRCLVCGQRWTTVEVRVGIKPVALPHSLAKLGKPAKPARAAPPSPLVDDEPDAVDDDLSLLSPFLPEIRHDDD